MRKVIYVLSHVSQWKVQCKHCNYYWIFETQKGAISFAKKHVVSLSAGTLSQILVQGADGRFRAEWTYGKDPYPPKG